MRMYVSIAAGAAALLLAGCTQAPAPAADTRDADGKTILQGEEAWNKDWAAKDVDKILSHYANDANLMASGMKIARGKVEMTPVLKALVTDPNLSLSFTATQVDVAKGGDLAYTRGDYSMTTTDDKTKKAVTEKGKYLTVYRRETDGSWKAIQDINSPDAPAAEAAK